MNGEDIRIVIRRKSETDAICGDAASP